MRSGSGEVRFESAVIAYDVVRSAKRRRTIAIALDTGRVVVRAPLRSSDAEIAAIVGKRAAWILKRLAAPYAAPLIFADGATFPFRGVPGALEIKVTISEGRRSSVRWTAPVLEVAVPAAEVAARGDEAVRRAVIRWLAARALEAVQSGIDTWAPRVGALPTRVFVRDQRTRWGSCSSDGSLRFNWRLALIAPELVEYVVVHELCHIRQANHSPAFWALVRSVLPDADGRRKRLRELGPIP
jgi:predicted metal-dependent hydrolase